MPTAFRAQPVIVLPSPGRFAALKPSCGILHRFPYIYRFSTLHHFRLSYFFATTSTSEERGKISYGGVSLIINPHISFKKRYPWQQYHGVNVSQLQRCQVPLHFSKLVNPREPEEISLHHSTPFPFLASHFPPVQWAGQLFSRSLTGQTCDPLPPLTTQKVGRTIGKLGCSPMSPP